MSAALVLAALRRSLALLPGQRATLLAAVSGGCDSMALLCGLHLLSSEMGFALHACHVQHGLRGESSLADERLVREACALRGIPLWVHKAHLGGDLHLPGMETRARKCRRAFFEADVKDLHAKALLTAHHRDDPGNGQFGSLEGCSIGWSADNTGDADVSCKDIQYGFQ